MIAILLTILCFTISYIILLLGRLKEYDAEVKKLNNKIVKLSNRLKVRKDKANKEIKPIKSQEEKDIEHISKYMSVSIDEAKKILKPLNLKSEKEYNEWIKTNSSKYLPVNLTQKYCKHNSWKGIPDFLGL